MNQVIQADYEQLKEIETRFGQEAEENQAMQQNLVRAFSPLEDGGWLGQGAEYFFKEMNGEILPAVRRLIDALSKADQVTQEIAELFRGEEEQAASVIKNGGNGANGTGAGAGGTNGSGAAGGSTGGAGSASSDPGGVGGSGGTGAGVDGGFDPGAVDGGFGGDAAGGVGAGAGGTGGGLGDSGVGGSFGNGGFDPSVGNSSTLDDILGNSGFTPPNDGISFDNIFGGSGIDEDLFVPEDFLDDVREAFGLDDNSNGSSPFDGSGFGDDGFGQDSAGAESESESDSGSGGGSGGGSGSGSGSGSESGGGSGGGGQSEGETGEEPLSESSEFSPQESFGGGGFGGGSGGVAEVSSPYGNSGFSSSFGSAGGFDISDSGTPESEGLRYQSMGAGLFGGGSTSSGLVDVQAIRSPGGGGAVPAAGNSGGSSAFGIPFGIAAVSPFLALLGKALKKKSDKDE